MSIPYEIKLEYIYNKLEQKFLKTYENAEPHVFDMNYVYTLIDEVKNMDIANDVAGITNLKFKYLQEVYISESGVNDYDVPKLHDIIEHTMECHEIDFDKLENDKIVYMAKKCVNINTAIDYIMKTNISKISETLIIDLHKKIGKNIIPTAGTYRTIHVGPDKTSRAESLYNIPKNIEKNLRILVKFVEIKLKDIINLDDDKLKIEKIMKLSTVLFSEFLLIHPFENGNGRVARLLTQCIFNHIRDFDITFEKVNNVFQIPISLYSGTRKKYIESLEARIDYIDDNKLCRNKPDYLYGYFIECVFRHYSGLVTQY